MQCREMSFPRVIAFLICVADLALGGLISNGFMLAMMVKEWTEHKRLGPSGQLLLSVGLSNICASASVTLNCIIMLLFFLEKNPANSLWFQIIFSFNSSVVCLRFWLAAWLCVFYCIKIVNYTCSFILWAKQKISRLIPWLLVGTLFVSFLLFFAIFSTLRYATQSNRTGIVTNGTQGKEHIDLFRSYQLFYIITGCACPFVIALLCSILSIASLVRHLCYLRSRESSSQSFQTKAYMKAIGTMVSLLFLYISWFLAQILPNSGLVKEELLYLPLAPVIFFYSPVQAVILVLANPKLKHTATQILQRTQK